ncbi:hypothetical protein SK128_006027, partial [Halocaridina rubra]
MPLSKAPRIIHYPIYFDCTNIIRVDHTSILPVFCRQYRMEPAPMSQVITTPPNAVEVVDLTEASPSTSRKHHNNRV